MADQLRDNRDRMLNAIAWAVACMFLCVLAFHRGLYVWSVMAGIAFGVHSVYALWRIDAWLKLSIEREIGR